MLRRALNQHVLMGDLTRNMVARRAGRLNPDGWKPLSQLMRWGNCADDAGLFRQTHEECDSLACVDCRARVAHQSDFVLLD